MKERVRKQKFFHAFFLLCPRIYDMIRGSVYGQIPVKEVFDEDDSTDRR